MRMFLSYKDTLCIIDNESSKPIILFSSHETSDYVALKGGRRLIA